MKVVKKIGVREVVEMLRKVLVLVSFILIISVVKGFAVSVEKLERDRELLKERAKRVLALAEEESRKLTKARSVVQYDAVAANMIGYLSEAELLFLAAEKVDKIVFGIDVLAVVVASGARLTQESYIAVSKLFVGAAEDALNTVEIIQKGSYTPETRRLAREVERDLREFLNGKGF
jgi:hypothetical protein